MAEQARLGYVEVPEPGHEHVVGRLAIPYLTKFGVVEIKFRCIAEHNCKEESCPKYLYAQGGIQRLYNVNALLEPSPVIAVTEGEIDALSTHLLVGIPAVGAPGASSWRPFWHRVFAGYEQVLVLADGDEPGRKFAERIVRGGKAEGKAIPAMANGKTIYLPDGTDSNDLIVKEGVEAFRARLGLDST